MKEFVNKLNTNFKKFYLPEEFLSIYANPESKEYIAFDAVRLYTLEVQLIADEPNEFEMACSLVEDFKGKNHKLVIDKFYSSP